MTPLHQLGGLIREGLLQVPLPAVRGLFLLTLAGVLVWVMLLPNAVTTPPGGAKRWDENLKYAAGCALALQILIYWLL